MFLRVDAAFQMCNHKVLEVSIPTAAVFKIGIVHHLRGWLMSHAHLTVRRMASTLFGQLKHTRAAVIESHRASELQ